jgi:hypothetical protein
MKKEAKMPGRKVTKSVGSASVKSGRMIPYGPAIRDAVARGDVQEMRKLSVSTKKWIKEVEGALYALERTIQKLEARK